jgi:AcrR family transcriptional regulator
MTDFVSNSMTTTRNGQLCKSKGRLDSRDWVKAAIEQLAAAGIDSVRVEVVARNLGVTKGSFYAHFKGRDELLSQILAYWRSRATLALIDRMNQMGASPRQRLEHLIGLVTTTRSRWGDDAELAIRLWAKRDNRARTTLGEVDEMRMFYIVNLLVEAGVAQEQAEARAVLVYAYMRVAPSLGTAARQESLQTARDMLLADTLH